MSITAPSIVKIINAVDGLSVDNQLMIFTKYSVLVLVNELREHALSYAKLEDLKKYSQCSKLCNAEIQKHNTKAPFKLCISQDNDGIYVELWCKSGIVEKEFLNTECNPMEIVLQYVQKMHRHVKEGRIEELGFIIDQWPTKIMQLSILADLKKLQFVLYDAMWDDFEQFTQTTTIRLEKLLLSDFRIGGVMLPNFFKSEFIKSMKHLFLTSKIQIDWEDFVNSTFELFVVRCWIDTDMVQEKFLKLIETNTAESFNLNITLPETETNVLDLDQVFPVDRFGQRRNHSSVIMIGSKIQVTISEDNKNINIMYFNN